MDEFSNRMDVQRKVLEDVNRKGPFVEELCGLSRRAIERWLTANRIDSDSEMATVLFQISEKLFFLSNKSQEQVTDEYRLVSLQIHALRSKLVESLANYNAA